MGQLNCISITWIEPNLQRNQSASQSWRRNHLGLRLGLSLATNRRESTRQQSKCCTKNRPTATNRRRLARLTAAQCHQIDNRWDSPGTAQSQLWNAFFSERPSSISPQLQHLQRAANWFTSCCCCPKGRQFAQNCITDSRGACCSSLSLALSISLALSGSRWEPF